MSRTEGAYAAIYGGVFLALGAQMAILPLWLSDRGLSDAAIGWIGAAALAARIVAGLAAPAIADRLDRRRDALRLCAALGVGVALAHAATPAGASAITLGVLSMLLAAIFAGALPIAEADGYASAERDGWAYRRARSVGSAAFLLATLLVGAAADVFGAIATPAALALGFAAAWIGATALAEPPRPARVRSAAAPEATRTFFSDPRTWAALVAAGAVQASHAVFYAFGSLRLETLGWSQTAIGGVWALGVAAEIAFFLGAARWAARTPPATALAFAAAAGIARWSFMTTDPGAAGVFTAQLLHALTFALAHLAALNYIAARAPETAAATAQGVLATLAGGALMLPATALAAALYPTFGGQTYWVGAAAAGLGLAAALALGVLDRASAGRVRG